MEPKKKESILMKDGVSYLVPFILITSCFALWGFANDITNPMVAAFQTLLELSAAKALLPSERMKGLAVVSRKASPKVSV